MLKEYRFVESAEDIRGSHLYGLNDEKLGKIDDVIFNDATGQIYYVVVDTGGWLTSKKFIVPAGRLRFSEKHKDDFAVDLNKQQIETFPPYQESDLESEEDWADYEQRYRSKWETNPVMHRAETDRNITPTAKQMLDSPQAAARPGAAGKAIHDTGAFTEPGFAASTDSVVIESSAVGIGGRWDRFQDRLRERRKEVIGARSDLRKAG